MAIVKRWQEPSYIGTAEKVDSVVAVGLPAVRVRHAFRAVSGPTRSPGLITITGSAEFSITPLRGS
jgi:hypothetical protein